MVWKKQWTCENLNKALFEGVYTEFKVSIMGRVRNLGEEKFK